MHVLKNTCFKVWFRPQWFIAPMERHAQWNAMFLTLFRIGGRRDKRPPRPVFPLWLLQTWELSPKTFWLLVLTLLSHWCKSSSSHLVPVPSYWTWTKATPQKKWFFWSNSYKIEVMITSLTEMLELPNFGHMTTFTL